MAGVGSGSGQRADEKLREELRWGWCCRVDDGVPRKNAKHGGARYMQECNEAGRATR